ncbi:nucleotidyltransferase domain-containing protein [Streptomyces hesseae]|uniref:Nucleotidyltransferase domain-containing protein n=1 Tax=Streptomyces hesseae TaxID=3075519 RepID=A0ABU2SXN4_9ACTN|nr:nucleotidyltransferase domain-containing protein [Streptomyces sp. DSM 40473]MDT0453761.1 nucleotidyltransferase domain-containing protein [Streptomyces sp. DSM 40473]
MNRWYEQRLRTARVVAEQLRQEHPGAQVWLEGPVGYGVAHARSDIDLRIVVPAGPAPAVRSRMADGVRVDLVSSTAADMDTLRAELGAFHMVATDLGRFRAIRRQLPALTALRTARVMDGGEEAPALGAAERDVYQKWALADRVHRAISLVEDLDGLSSAGLYDSAGMVLWQLSVTVMQAENAAAGLPLLGDKWTPVLAGKHTALPSPLWEKAEGSSPCPDWFRQARVRLLNALLVAWPAAGSPDAQVDPAWGRFGWLPQRYSDDWSLQYADTRIALTTGQFLAWAAQVAS